MQLRRSPIVPCQAILIVCRRLVMPASVPVATTKAYTRHLHIVEFPGGIPDTHSEHSEGTTTILVPKDAGAFLNPVQEFNRDLSVAVIRAWNELRKEELEGRWTSRSASRKRKGTKGAEDAGSGEPRQLSKDLPPMFQRLPRLVLMKKRNTSRNRLQALRERLIPLSICSELQVLRPSIQQAFRAPRFTILEALSATGLRAIRYAKEIPDVK